MQRDEDGNMVWIAAKVPSLSARAIASASATNVALAANMPAGLLTPSPRPSQEDAKIYKAQQHGDGQVRDVNEEEDEEEDEEAIAALLVNKTAAARASLPSPDAAVDASMRDRPTQAVPPPSDERQAVPSLAALSAAEDMRDHHDAIPSESDCDSDATPEEAPIVRCESFDDYDPVQVDSEVHSLDLARSDSKVGAVDGSAAAPAAAVPPASSVAIAQKPCRDWVQTGTCRWGTRCRYLHDPSLKGRARPAPAAAAANAWERDDMIGKLMYNEVRREVSDLTQVIDFLARNRWLENVELRPGMKKEKDNRIKVVGASRAHGEPTAAAATVQS